MNIVFGNFAGLWALLGIPIVLAIHLIQQRFKKHTISTLFLLEGSSTLQTETKRIDWIQNSLQLWVQLLAVICVALILGQPAIETMKKSQRIAFVLDSSYSMNAFREEINKDIERSVNKLRNEAELSEWTLLETAPYSGTLYRGRDVDSLLAAVKNWRPSVGRHPIEIELDARRRLLGEASQIIFISDHLQEISDDIEQHSVGAAIENWGISGFNVKDDNGKPVFEAVVRNYGQQLDTRSWWVKINDSKRVIGEITLKPGQFTTVRTSIPDGADSQVLGIDSDQFVLDDSLPLVRPKMNKLLMYLQRSRLSSRLRSLVYSTQDVRRVNVKNKAALILQSFQTAPADLDKSSIQIFDARRVKQKARSKVHAERHPLTSHLRWDGLRVGSFADSKLKKSDRVLLWSDSKPALYVSTEKKRLVVAFDIRNSNALEHPAFIILLHRFIADVRRDAPGFWRINVSSSQKLSSYFGEELLKEARLQVVDLQHQSEKTYPRAYRAPAQPSFFKVLVQDEEIAVGAASFGDAAESNFTGFKAGSRKPKLIQTEFVDKSLLDANRTLLLLLLLLLLCASWLTVRSSTTLSPSVGRS